MRRDSHAIDLFNPINRHHPLNRKRLAWWIALRGLSGGPRFQDLFGFNHGVLTGLGAGYGWQGTTRPGGQGCVSFDGANGHYVNVTTATRFDLGQVPQTVAAWFRTSYTGDYQALFAQDNATNGHNQLLLIYPTTGLLKGYTGGSIISSVAGVADGYWHRAVLVFDGASTQTLYIDGVQVATGAAGTNFPSGQNVTIGESGFGGSLFFPFKGQIDDVSLWARALSTGEVRADYDLSRAGYPGVLRRIGRGVNLFAASLTPPPPPIPPDPYGVSSGRIAQITTQSQQLAARTHRQSAQTENPIELYYLRDSVWRLFPIQPVTGPTQGLELTQTYKQPSTLGFTLPDPQGLYGAENRNSTYNYNNANVFDPLLDEARKILLRVGTKCYTNLAAGRVPTASASVALGMLAGLTDGIFYDWSGRTAFGNAAAWALSGTAPTLDVTIDLGASYWLRHVAIRFGTSVGGFTLPVSVTVQISADNVTYQSWPARSVGGPVGDWAESYDGQAVEVAVCDLETAARYVRFHIVGVDGSTSLAIDEVAVYGGYQFAVLGANVFTGYLGDQIDFTPTGRIACVAVDVLKKLADNNDVFLTAAYRLTSNGGVELADIAFSLLTSSAYWKGDPILTPGAYDNPLTADEIGWGNEEGLTGLRYPLWQGQTNSIYGYCLELFHTIGWDFWADGNGVLQATDPPTTQEMPDRVCIAGGDGNNDVSGCERHRTGKDLRNNVIVQTGRSASAGSASITLFDPNSIARYGTRTTRITDPLASTNYLRERVAQYFLRDYAWNIQTLTNTIRPQFETRMKQVFGFRAPARPNLYAKASSVAGNLRSRELWSLVALKHNITYGQWTADASWIPYVPQSANAPNFTALNTIGGDPNELDAVFDVVTDPRVVRLNFYTSKVSAFSGFTLHSSLSNVTLPTHYNITGLTTSVPVWVYITAAGDQAPYPGNESVPSIVLTATPGSASQAATCYTITDFSIGSIITEGPDSQGYYTYQFLGLWTAPACGFTRSDVRAYVEPVPGAGPPGDQTNPKSWPIHDDSWNWWAPNRIHQGLTWDNSTPGQLDFVFTLRSKSVLFGTGKRMYWRIWNSVNTRSWRPVPGNFSSCIVGAP